MSNKDDSVTGKVQEAVGWLTGDREAEAKGKLKRLDAADTDDGASGADEAETVEQAEKDLRQDYEEYDPAVDDAPLAEDTTPAEKDPRSGV